MGRFHLGRLFVREVTADFLASGSVLGVIFFEPLLDPLGLLLQTLHLAFPVSATSRT
jgi:hypothetical protein